MMTKPCDLHIHTTCSDGLTTPEEIVSLAIEAGLRAIAITDHDTTDGIDRAMRASEQSDGSLEIIPGIELSALVGKSDVHILGYFIDHHNEILVQQVHKLREARHQRAQQIVARLNDMGLDLKFETVLEVANNAVLGRPHIAEALLKEELIYSFDEAFAAYIGYDKEAYVPKYQISPQEAMDMIVLAGGIPVLAHPGTLRRDELIPSMIKAGLQGIEAVHPMHPRPVVRYYRELAQKNGIIHTGGSDYHGERRGHRVMPEPDVPLSILEDLRALVHKHLA